MAARFCRTRDRAVTDDGQPRSVHHVDGVTRLSTSLTAITPERMHPAWVFLFFFRRRVARSRHGECMTYRWLRQIGSDLRKKRERNPKLGAFARALGMWTGGEKACEPARAHVDYRGPRAAGHQAGPPSTGTTGSPDALG